MRQIEFRGKLLNTNVWIYGNLRIHFVDGDFEQENSKYFIEYNYIDKLGKVHRDSYEVDTSTIGQFTGLIDQNDKKIYEGDIIQSNKSKYKRFDDDGIYEIYFNEFLCHYALIASRNEWEQKHGAYDNYSLTGAKTRDFEVIGNIHTKENK